MNLQSERNAAAAFLLSKSCVKSSCTHPYPGTMQRRELQGGETAELSETGFWVSLTFSSPTETRELFPLVAPVRVTLPVLGGGWGWRSGGREQRLRK